MMRLLGLMVLVAAFFGLSALIVIRALPGTPCPCSAPCPRRAGPRRGSHI